MEVTKQSRTRLRLQNYAFVVLFLAVIGLLAWLSHRYNFEADWTATGRNVLSEASKKVLERMEGPVSVTAFATESELIPTRKRIRETLARYQRIKQDIELSFVNPQTDPQRTRELGIKVDGELVIEYNGRSEHVQNLTEETLTNALQRLMRSGERNVVFITGHGERAPSGTERFDLGAFTRHLETKGIKVSAVNLAEARAIPDNTAVLVIASPQVAYLAGEVQLVRDYLRAGGNLLWLHEPGNTHGLDAVARDLGVSFVPGVIVDPTTQMLGIANPSLALVTGYPEHPISSDFHLMTLYPQSVGVRHDTSVGWNGAPFLQTARGSWSETGPMRGVVELDPANDTLGPLTIGLALSRELNEDAAASDGQSDAGDPAEEKASSDDQVRKQRVVILGDGDFLSNTYLGNQGNQDMGHNIVNWLSHDDSFIAIPAKTAPDTQLSIDEATWSVVGLFFLIVLPLLLLASGVVIWWRRRKR
ncbi:MAG: GldG family protein [Pseudomonadota bacterium]|nr:MAG: GldG family protein [Pseudomonadota bacterium]